MSTPNTIQDDSHGSAQKNMLEEIKEYIANNLAKNLNAAVVAENFQISISSLLHRSGMNSE